MARGFLGSKRMVDVCGGRYAKALEQAFVTALASAA